MNNIQKKLGFAFGILSFPIGMFVNLYSSFKYQELEKIIEKYEKYQLEIIEENDKGINYINLLNSSDRIWKYIKENNLELKKEDKVTVVE